MAKKRIKTSKFTWGTNKGEQLIPSSNLTQFSWGTNESEKLIKSSKFICVGTNNGEQVIKSSKFT